MSIAGWKEAEAAIRNAHWVIERLGARAKSPHRVSHHVPGAYALHSFFKACDKGSAGTYRLLGMAAQKEVVLATAEVVGQEMTITWHPEWILFSLGAKGMHDAVHDVLAFLREEGALPKVDADEEAPCSP